MKQKKRNFKVGDTVYYETPDGVEKDTIMAIDGQELILPDYNSIYKRDCLANDDPRIKNAKQAIYLAPPEDMLKQQMEE